MLNKNSIHDLEAESLLIVHNETVVEVSSNFVNMTEYPTDKLINQNIAEILITLRMGPSIDIKNIDNQSECFLFTKSLEVRFINLEVREEMDKLIFVFREKPNSRLEDRFSYPCQILTENQIGVSIYSAPDFTLLKANQLYLDFCDAPYNIPENTFGKSIYDFITGYRGSQVESMINNVLATGKSEYLKELRYDKFARGITYWDQIITPIKENGKVKYIITNTREVTEKVFNKIKLEEKNKQLISIIKSISDNITIIDRDGKIVEVAESINEKFNNFGKTYTDVYKEIEVFDLGGSIVPLEETVVQKVLRGERVKDQTSLTIINGKKFYFDDSGVPIFNDKKEFELGIVVSNDITELIEQRNLIKKQKEQLESELEVTKLLQRISMELYLEDNVKVLYEKIVDAAMEIMHSEFASLQMLHNEHGNFGRLELLAFRGFDPQSAKFWEWVDTESGSACGEALRKDKRVIVPNIDTCEFMQGTEDLAVFHESGIKAVQTSPLYSRSGKLVGMLSTHWRKPHEPSQRELGILDLLSRQAADLIEQKLCEDKLLRSEKEKNESLKKAIEMKDEFISLISHEFKTPINVIHIAIQALNSIYADELTDKVKEYLGTIKQNTFRQLRLVNNLLDITRANSGRIKINKKNIDIVFITKAITESVYQYASQKGVRLRFISKYEKKIIGLDDEKYERILLNLLSNAIKFTQAGKSIFVSLRYVEGSICVEVKDKGIGIPPNKIDLIFERFGQVDSSLSRRAEGTGIGLSLVKKFSEALGGSVSVKSKVGKGSTFTILLPDEKVCEENNEKLMVELMDNRLIQTTNVEFSDIYL